MLSQKRAVAATWKLTPNMGKTAIASGNASPEPDAGFWIELPHQNLEPGFYDCTVEVDFGEKSQNFVTTFGFAVDQIPPPPPPPADFQSFWDAVREEVGGIPLNADAGLWQRFDGEFLESYINLHAFLPKRFDPKGSRFSSVDVQTVAFDSLNGYRVNANVAKPPVEGRLPAILILPGAGNWNFIRPFPIEHARHGYLAMDVAVLGVGTPPAPTGDERRDHKDFRMIANALQALRYLKSRPDVDPEKIIVAGMSQGGRLSIVLSALDPKIQATVTSIVHHADLGLNFRLGNDKSPPSPVSAYYDVASFSPFVKNPTFVTAGLVDRVSPASAVYAAYRAIPAKDKVFLPMPGIGHFVTFEADRRAWRWLENLVAPAPSPAN